MSLLKKALIGIACFIAYSLFGFYIIPLAPSAVRTIYTIFNLALWCVIFLGLVMYAARSTWKTRRLESVLLLILSIFIASFTVPIYVKMIIMYTKAALIKEEVDPNIAKLKTEKELTEFINNSSAKPAVVKVSAVWCPPCQQLKPVYHEVANQLKESVQFAEIDINQFDKPQATGAASLPTIIIFKNGKEVNKLVGFKTAEQLNEEFAKVK